uniref:Uncharacterized protein n=1 Tax=Aegilops tauschii subsp. strangulata TaxID=200361 RepID=A0A453NJT3_AEGTS
MHGQPGLMFEVGLRFHLNGEEGSRTYWGQVR